MSAKLRAQTHYRISFPNRNGHLIEIDARFSGTLGQAEVVNHPVWTPGSYLIREYPKNIEEIAAVNDAGASLPLERLNKASWRVQNGGQPFHVKYRHYSNELSVRNAHIDASHCFFTPAAILVYAPSLATNTHEVEIVLPADWTTISTPLPSKAKVFVAANLDELMDSPFEIGSHKEQSFSQDGVKYRLASYPANLTFSEGNLADIKRVVHQANQVFAPAPVPVQEYLFITHINGGGGGLEHKFGSVLQTSPKVLADTNAFQGFLSLVAHEYFHLWNVKRIKPRRLGPFDYQQENYTSTLWFAEGITSYYDDLIVTRAGIGTADEYLKVVESNINNAGSVPGWRIQSLESASYESWIKYYRPNENSLNATVNYYTQGSVAGWAIDMRIRALTKGQKSLDDVMRLLWQKAKADDNFYADREAIGQAMSQVAGSDQNAWLEGLVAKPAFPDIEALSIAVGLLPIDKRKERFWPSLGIGQQKQGDKLVATFIYRGSPAEQAGVSAGDVLVKLDGKALTDPYKEDELTFIQNQPVVLEVLRAGEPKSFTLNVGLSPRVRWQLTLPAPPPPALLSWLKAH